MKICLVRHTQPLIDAGVCYGRSDVPLPSHAKDAFPVVAQKLRTSVPQCAAVFSSPLQRCLELAQFIYPNEEVCVDPRLREMDFGHWEMCSWDVVPRTELDAWAADVGRYTPPGGENWMSVYNRCRSFANEHLTDPHASYCLITHAGIIRTFLALFLQNASEKTSKKTPRTPGAVPGDPTKGLPALLAEPIDYGAICYIEVCSTTDQVSYTISSSHDNG